MTSSLEERILEGLTSEQRAAVVHGEGPLLIIAGAGTGKTTVLTRRIAHLVSSKRARPEEVLALTFTEKAAVEMAERVDQLVPYGYADSWIGTFHAFGDRILRDAALEQGMNPDFRVLSRPEQIIFLRERLWRLPLERFRPLGDPTQHLHALLGMVSRAKDEDISPAGYRDWAEARHLEAQSEEDEDDAQRHLELAAFYARYQELLTEAGVVDFGDQIYRALTALRERPAALEKIRARYKYVLVDEFQDTNHAQLELLRLVAGDDEPNITAVGDDDQAIYRWRGAAEGNLLAFRDLYPESREVVLTANHRSTQVILDASAQLISYNNPYRLEVIAGIDKRLRSARVEGPPVRHLHFDTVSAEADYVADVVAERLQQGHRPRDIAILVRSNDDADPFLRALNMREVPHHFSGSRGLYAREEVRLLVSLLRVLASPSDSVATFYLASSSVFQVPARALLRLNEYARRKTRPLLDLLRELPENEDLASIEETARTAAARLVSAIDAAAVDVPRRRTGEVLYKFLQSSGTLGRLSAHPSAENEARVKNIAKFFETVRAYGEIAEHDRVPAFVEHLDMLRDAGDDPAVADADPEEDAVHVLTVHKAKGLEFPVVLLVGCAERKFPVQRRSDPLELPAQLVRAPPGAADPHLHEERRLFYVAMTRAKEELILTSAADYGTTRARKVSRFVVETLDLPSPAPIPRRSHALEALARFRVAPEPVPTGERPLPPDILLRLSFNQIDDYQTCPLKYRYVHVMRVPLLVHHRIVYGSAIHKAIQHYFKRVEADGRCSEEELLRAFRDNWVSEGFLSREHEERRIAAGEETLGRFLASEQASPLRPTGVEEEFKFYVDRNKIVGRYDLVVDRDGSVSILDFKTGAVDDVKKARKRALESLQLDIYALAYLRTRGRLPDWVELRFLESGLSGGKKPTAEHAEATEAMVRDVGARIRKREFPARPSWMACAQCAFRDFCPHTARGGGEGG